MEAANVLGVPVFVYVIAHWQDARLGFLTLGTLIPVCALLVVGAAYWRAKLKQIDGEDGTLVAVLAQASRWQVALLLATVAAIGLAGASWFVDGLSVSFGDRVAASALALLAALEYVNYYHRQLQHFDHMADLKRLLRGNGFRKAQMAVDLERFRAQLR